MSTLVTGGAGYIGSVTVERLVAQGEKVVVYDDFSTGHHDALDSAVTVVEGNIRDTARLVATAREHDADTVLNFAAFIQVGESVVNPRIYFENNTMGALSVLSAAQEAGVKRFIQSSTAAVYGNPVDDNTIDETHPTDPVNPYGLSKLMVEQMLRWYSEAYGIGYVALRYFNACGATERLGECHSPESHLIPLILFAAQDPERSITVFGKDYDTPDGTCVRDYVHVADIADAHWRAMQYLKDGGTSEAINLGTSMGTSVLGVIDSVRRITGRDPRIEYGERRAGDATRLVASSGKAKRLLGWKAEQSDIDTIVSDAWRWFAAHPDGYAR